MFTAIQNDNRSMLAPWIKVILSCVVCLVLAYTALSRCSYKISSDETEVVKAEKDIRHGYFQKNWAALNADVRYGEHDLEHVERQREGGFSLLFFLLSVVSRRLPFYINGLFVPLMILSFAWLLYLLDDNRQRGWLSGIFLIAFILLSPGVSGHTWRLVKLVRDASAHAIGIAGLAIAVLSRGRAKSRKWIFFSGIMIGFSAWFRATGVLFAAPVALYLAIYVKGRSCRDILKDWFCLGSGVLLGLVPVFAQNILEGKNFLSVGRAEGLVKVQTFSEQLDVPKKGLHPSNFKIWFLPSVERLIMMFGVFQSVMVAAAIVACASLWRRRTVMLLSSFAMYLLFYSCYDKLVGRYLLIVALFGSCCVAVCLGWLADKWMSGIKDEKARSRALMLLLAIMLVFISVRSLQASWKWEKQRIEWRDAKRFQNWLESDFTASDAFVSYAQSVRMWIDYFSGLERRRSGWGWYNCNNPDRSRQRCKSNLDGYLSEGRKVYFLSLYDEKRGERLSWWKEDLKNEYDISKTTKEYVYHNGRKILCYEVRKKDSRLVRFRIAGKGLPSRDLFLYARKLSVAGRWQDVTISSGKRNVKTKIQAGPNIVRMPSAVSPGGVLSIESSDPLPSFLFAGLLDDDPVRLYMGNYHQFPSVYQMTKDARLDFRGFKSWRRDVGGDSNRSHRSWPMWFLGPESSLRLPRTKWDVIVRLYWTGEGLVSSHSASCDCGGADVRYSMGGKELSARTIIVDQSHSSRRGLEHVVDEVLVPGSILRRQDDPDLVVDGGCRYKRCEKLQLEQIELVNAEGYDRLDKGRERILESHVMLSSKEARWFRSRSYFPWLDSSFRVLDKKVTIRMSKEAARTEAALLLSVYWPEGNKDDVCAMEIGKSFRSKIRPLEMPQLLLVPTGAMGLKKEVEIDVGYKGGTPQSYATIDYTEVVMLDEEGFVPDIIFSPDYRFEYLLSGLWAPEQQPDGGFGRWTKGCFQADLPVAGRCGKLGLKIELRGAPMIVGELPLEIKINGEDVGRVAVEPDVWQTVDIVVRPGLIDAGMNRLELTTRVWSPVDVSLGNDDRKLGVFLKRIRWQKAD